MMPKTTEMQNGEKSEAYPFEISALLTPTKSGGSLCTLLGSLLRDYSPEIKAQLVVVVPENQKTDVLYRKLIEFHKSGVTVKFILVPEHKATDVPQWRAMAWEAALGRTAVFLEDNAVVEPGWWAGWLESARQEEWTISTGLVNADTERLTRTSTGVFFCEYGLFVPAARHRHIRHLKRVAGNHWAVRRDKIENNEPMENSIDEFEWVKRHCSLLHKPHWNERARVKCNREIGLKEAFVERARQGFHFGRVEAINAGWFRRLKMLHGGPAIVAVQMARLTFVIAQRRSHLGLFLKSLPWTLFLIKTWSLAEWAGWGVGSVEPFFKRDLKHRAKKQRESTKKAALPQQTIVEADNAPHRGIPAPHLAGRYAEKARTADETAAQ